MTCGCVLDCAVETLLKTVPASQLAVSVGIPEKTEGLRARGVEVRQGYFDYPETLNSAFADIDRLLIISVMETMKREFVSIPMQ